MARFDWEKFLENDPTYGFWNNLGTAGVDEEGEYKAQGYYAGEAFRDYVSKVRALNLKEAEEKQYGTFVEQQKGITAANLMRKQQKPDYNIAKTFADEYQSPKNVLKRYANISSHEPEVTYKAWDPTGSNLHKMTKMEIFKNQTLGIFGDIKNLDKPKEAWVYQGSASQDQVTSKKINNAWESAMKINVVAEDKKHYYARDENGDISAFRKDNCSDTKPTEDFIKYNFMQAVLQNKGNSTASTLDKFRYNMSQGMGGTIMGAEEKDFIPTGNKALDVISNVGGELLGFAAPTGATSKAGGLMSELSEISGKGITKLGTKTAANPKTAKAGAYLTQGLGKSMLTGASDLGILGAMEEDATPKSIVEQAALGAAGGAVFHGAGKLVGKGIKGVKGKFGKVPETSIPKGTKVPESKASQKTKDAIAKAAKTKELEKQYQKEIEKQVEYIKNTKGKKPMSQNAMEALAKKQLRNEYGRLYNGTIGKSKTVEALEKQGYFKKVKTEVPRAKPETNDTRLNLQMFGENEAQTAVNNEIRDRVAKHIVSSKVKTSLREKAGSMWKNIHRLMIDRNNVIGDFTKAAEKAGGGKLPTHLNPAKMAENSTTYSGIAYNSLEKGVTDKIGNKVSKSFKEVADKIPKHKEQDFQTYIVAKHAIDWMNPAKKLGTGELSAEAKQVFPKDITTEQLKQIVKSYETNNPEFKATQKELVRYSRAIMKTQLVDSGLISKKLYRELLGKYPNYVPLQRQFKTAEKTLGNIKSGQFVNTGSGLKKATGSTREIITPYESIIKNTYNLTKASKNNEVGQTILKQLLKHPEELSHFGRVVEKVDDYTLENAIKSGELSEYVEAFNEQFTKLKKLNKPNIVNVKMDGKTYKMEIQDTELLKALTGLNKDNANSVINASRAITNRMKQLTTGNNIAWSMIKNLPKDLFGGYVQSKTSSKLPIVGPLKYMGEVMGAGIESILKTNGYKNYKAVGGGWISSVNGVVDTLAQKGAKKYIRGDSLGKKAGKAALKPLDWLQSFTDAIETAPRYREYKKTVKKLVKKGVSKYEAQQEGLFEAADVTVNFKRGGNLAKEADAFIPYLNAAIQGLDKFARTVKNPKTAAEAFYKSINALTLPAMFLYAANKGNEDYEQLSQWTKDTNFMIPLGPLGLGKGTFAKVAKPREWGMIFGTIPERLMDKFEYEDPDAFKGLLSALAYAFVPPDPVTGNILFPIGRNIISEQGSTWRGTPVVSTALKDLPPHLQYNESTSRPAIFMSKILNNVGIEFSPMKLDDIGKSYLGVIAQFGIPGTSNRVANEADALDSAIEILRRMSIADPKYSNDLANTFYDNMKKATQDKMKAQTKGELGEDEEYFDNAVFNFGQAARQIADLRKEQKAAKSNTEKDRIQEEMNDIYKKLNEDYRDNYKSKGFMNSYERKREFKRY